MKYFIALLTLLFSGCSGSDKNILLNTGNLPPSSFHFSSKQTIDNFVFDTQKFSFKFPTSKQTDFTQIGKWHGVSIRDGHTISFGLDMYYSVAISTSYKASVYGERERAIERKDVNYIKKLYHKYNLNTNISIKNYGKENYSCVVIEATKHKYSNKKEISYQCYKFNKNRTKYKSVRIGLTYNKPNNPTLAKKYTYQDLQNRAKRVLGSLYIKDGW